MIDNGLFHLRTNNSKQREIFVIALCFVVGFVLRFYTFDKKSLWIDEIYTFGDSRDDIKGQLEFYEKNPTYLHPPLFFILSHQFHPFTKPERDLRIIPLVFGSLSIPMIYFLAKTFSSSIALPCTLSLTFMTYHISLSQDGRSYSLLMFFGMAGLYFFMKHLRTLQKKYLFPIAVFFSLLCYMSYTSIAFVLLSQILWFYRPPMRPNEPTLYSSLILNGLILFFCLPWILFVALNVKGPLLINSVETKLPMPFWNILYGVLDDWMLHAPLLIVSASLLVLFPFITKERKNAFVLLGIFVLPIGGLHLFCTSFDFTHFVTSRYLINFLPLFLITLFLSLNALEERFERLKSVLRFKSLFAILLITSNLIILPLYYQHEKQDFRSLAFYLMNQIQDGDKVVVRSQVEIYGLLHYFGVELPKSREFAFSQQKNLRDEIEYGVPLIHNGKRFTITYPRNHSHMVLIAGRNRLWVVADQRTARGMKDAQHLHLMGYFDGSFLNLNRFPTDASMYLFLWDPKP